MLGFPARRRRYRRLDDSGNPGVVTLGGNGESLVNHSFLAPPHAAGSAAHRTPSTAAAALRPRQPRLRGILGDIDFAAASCEALRGIDYPDSVEAWITVARCPPPR